MRVAVFDRLADGEKLDHRRKAGCPIRCRAGANQVLRNLNRGELPHELFLEQIRRNARDVLPALQAHTDERAHRGLIGAAGRTGTPRRCPMREFEGRTAFVTGGASGIGLALGQAFAAAGMNVMLADIEQAALDQAVAGFAGGPARVRGVRCDVSSADSVREAAERTLATFGKVHVLCNNAGVSKGGLMEQISVADWEWVIGVNLMGVVHGIRTFLPHLKAHGEPGHIVNTASLYGVLADGLVGPYCATKFAVVGLSEVLAAELADGPIGVSVLCPGWVRTRILESWRNRPDRFGGPVPPQPDPALAERAALVAQALRAGTDPKDIAAQVLQAIREGQFYIFTHPQFRGGVEARQQRLLSAFDQPVRPQPVGLAR